MSLRTAAMVFGVVFVLVGIAGYVDALTPDGRLFGLFAVNGPHNIIHLVSGAAALAAAGMGELASRRYFQIFAVIYGLVTLLGVFVGHGELLGFVAHNGHDVWLHLLITLAAAYFGFSHNQRLARA
jgi:uncharacterized protein DUF4383